MGTNPNSASYQPNLYYDSEGNPQSDAEDRWAQRAQAIDVATSGSASYTQEERESAARALQNNTE